ncbi:MAG TPA: hypothetical protein VMF30_16170 [Pirellulales bacterium]|nr:hypothetical protein [Pirellulales bacterium]
MNTPRSMLIRRALAGLVVGLVANFFLAAGEASEIAPPPDAPPAADPAWSDGAWKEIATDDAAALVDVGEAAPADEMADLADRGAPAADEFDPAGVAAWLPAAAGLSCLDGAWLDAIRTAVASLGGGQMVCGTLWELEDLEGPRQVILTPHLAMLDLKDRDSFAAAEVAFVMGNVAAPSPDLVFLAFVALQSLWGLVSNARRD